MWTVKRFRSAAEQAAWIAANQWRYRITVLYVNNGWAVEYKRLRVI